MATMTCPQTQSDGLFVEPPAAAGLTALERMMAAGAISAGEEVVLLLTGGGFRELAALPPVEPGGAVDVPMRGQPEWLSHFITAS